jgi:5-methylcytosine-specific restriction endonuclease McrA
MITLARFKNKEILPQIGLGMPKLTLATDNGTFKVKASSNRLECLKRSQQCVRCRRSGTIWLLQVSVQRAPRVPLNCFIEDCPWCALKRKAVPVGTETPHLNLFHPDRRGRLLLFTQDHIFPRHAGGSDSIDNLQTMCSECNSYKGGMLPEEYERSMLPHERAKYSGVVARGGSSPGGSRQSQEPVYAEANTSDCAAE